MNADPSGVTADVIGNFELHVDPSDPAQSLIYINNAADGPSRIVAARVDGTTGLIQPGTLTTVADNFDGRSAINGPEFVSPPGSGLGILYRDLTGVHGVFRPLTPKAWNDFSVDVFGAPTGKNPPRLPSTYHGSYDGGGLPFGQLTYTLTQGPCALRCFASMRTGVPTDAANVLAKSHLQVPFYQALTQSTVDGTIFAVACKGSANNAPCGIYTAAIDGRGGFVAGSLRSLVTLSPRIGQPTQNVALAVAIHPATRTTVVFLGWTHPSGQSVDVYEQRVAGGPLALVTSVPVEHSSHFRIRANGNALVLHYLIRHGGYEGNYSISVGASGGQLQVGASKLLANAAANGTQMAYLPAAGRFALYYRTPANRSELVRCFVDP